MLLETRQWGTPGAESVVCLHGLTQDGSIFAALAGRLASERRRVVAVDLRAHGGSGRLPPWNIETHVADLHETLDALGIQAAAWIGHSFGGRLAATVAAEAADRVQRLVLLDPALEASAELAYRSAEIERLDWSFATVDGAVRALMGSPSVVAAPESTVAAYVRNGVQKGPDGRFRFRFCPSAAVVGWSEMVRPAPPIADVPTLIVRAEKTTLDHDSQLARYEQQLGPLLEVTAVPNGHNVLWESPGETAAAVEGFLG